jgi:hypothetical protein
LRNKNPDSRRGTQNPLLGLKKEFMREQLKIRLYKTVGDITFLALYMLDKDVDRCVLSVFKATHDGYQYIMDISVEYWNDPSSDEVLNRAARL